MRGYLFGTAMLMLGALSAPPSPNALRYTSGDTSNSITLHSQTGEAYLLHLVRYHGLDDQVILLELVLTHPGSEENLLPKINTPPTIDFVAKSLRRQSARTFNLPNLALKFQVTVASLHTTGDCKAETTADCTLKDLQLKITTLR